MRNPIRLLTIALLALLLGTGAAQAQVNAYVANTGNTSVQVIDTATNTVTTTISGTGARTLTLSPDGQFLYSTNGNGMSKIDIATNTIVGSVATGNIPVGIAVTADGAKAYVNNNGSGTVSVVDTATMTVTATLSIPSQAIATAPDGTSIWVGSNIFTPPAFPAVMYVIDSATDTFTTFPLGHGSATPTAIAFTPDGAFAYLANFSANLVAVLDVATRTEVTSITAGNRPVYSAVSPDGAFVYVANLLGNNVSVIDTATNTVVATVPVGAFPRELAFTPDGAFVYVTNSNSSTVSVIDTATLTVVSTISGFSFPWGIAMVGESAAPPVLTSDNATVTVNEGQTATNTGTVTDANGDTVTLSASVGTVVNNGDGTWSWSFGTSDGPTQSQTVTITGDDGQGGTSTTSFTLTVNNVAPTITNVSNNGPVITGNPAAITVTATDPAGANDPLAYEFDCDNNGVFEIGPQAGNSASCTFPSAGSYTVNARVNDGDGGVVTGSTVVTVVFPPPSCANATASPNLLWPPNHKYVSLQISGIANPAPGAVAITVTSIFQDERVLSPGSGNTSPDAIGVGTARPSVRAERDGGNDGRVYHIAFTATGAGGSCTGTVKVGVPKSQGNNGGPVDQGPLYDSTQP